MTFSLGENETETDFVLHKRIVFLHNVKAISEELQQAPAIIDKDTKKIRKARKTCIEKRQICLKLKN